MFVMLLDKFAIKFETDAFQTSRKKSLLFSYIPQFLVKMYISIKSMLAGLRGNKKQSDFLKGPVLDYWGSFYDDLRGLKKSNSKENKLLKDFESKIDAAILNAGRKVL